MLIDPANRVFVAQRRGMQSGAWQMPQGGIDEGEAPRDAALRELAEETGTDRAEIIAESRGWFDYDLPVDLVPRVWHGRYRGQRQKWFAMRFLGQDGDIDLEAHDPPEFSAWRWAPPEQLPALIVPFKRQLYRDVLAEFARLFDAEADRQ
jgi:putative (di)nucleoside polyphosphate hydrolase